MVIWDAVVGTQPPPRVEVIYATAAAAVIAVAYGPIWSILRHAVTIAHEGGHAAVATMAGRRLRGVRLHSDTSGLTVSAGRPTGPGVVLTLLAGYTAPSLLGLAAVVALSHRHAVGMLWGALVLLALLLIQIRNLFGFVSVVVSGAVLAAVSWWAPSPWQSAIAYLLTWFLLVSGPRPVIELQRSRRQGRAPSSDADQLGRLTHLPGLIWVIFFFVITVGILVIGARRLIGG